ncbi:hypothetical protein JCM19241_3351 [Vibrio ishigakensis]|uniref:Alpha-acetolactate decarboxylase n=1 Tax=Vibrio ishigakensis TaxID=1481914 RepID=A0A0B8QM02_9VIBR|nr:hypothetical protein JCM19241_3351 [Vibrio ishigakensis]
MKSYAQQLLNLVTSAIDELEADHKKGRLANTPVSNTNFLLRWVTKSLKQQRFSKLMVKDLTTWQKQGRSKGTQTGLYQSFTTIRDFYQHYFPDFEAPKPILDSQINQYIDHMESIGWSVCTEYDLSGDEKGQLFTEGDSSLVLCAHQCDDCFVDGKNEDGTESLMKPMSFYVRGNHAEFIKEATKAGFLVHKQTDYKSKVKYHGEYLIYPNNLGGQLAEIPIGFNAEEYP